MSEQEATKKWCVFQPRYYVNKKTHVCNYKKDETYSLSYESLCIGDECMAWRNGECGRIVPNAEVTSRPPTGND